MSEKKEKPKPAKPYSLMGELLKPREVTTSSKESPYLYPALPERCYCHTRDCGYVREKPGQHCRELKCPKCGARLWRVPA